MLTAKEERCLGQGLITEVRSGGCSVLGCS